MTTVTSQPNHRPNGPRQYGTPCLILAACAASAIALGGCTPSGPPTQNTPVASAGSDQVVIAGAGVTLDGSGSQDADGDTLTYAWVQTAGAPVALSSATDPVVTFTAPAKGAALTFMLTVSDASSSARVDTRVSVQPFDASSTIVEIRQPSINDDPAVTDNFPHGWTVATQPPGPQNIGKGAPPWIEQVEIAPRDELELPPGAKHEIELQVTGASAVMGSVRWIGTSDALPVEISLDGAVLGAGDAYSIGGNRGGSNIRVKASAGGRIVLSVTNTSATTLTIRMDLGALVL